jgi:hypothetical protein
MREPAMRTILTALILTIATQAGAECGNLCDHYWWKTTTEADLQAELDAGADFMARTNYGDTPLHRVSSSGNSLFIIALLDAGADVMARDNGGNTPLHETAGYGSPDNIQALLDAGTNINARANDGRTPRHWAVTCHLSPVNSGVNLVDYKSCWPLVQTQNLKIKKAKRRVT